MRKNGVVLYCLAGLLLWGPVVFPQEREKPVVETSEDELGNVKDEFQELFFEALKQKAIENYDKAVDALLKALKVNPDQTVVWARTLMRWKSTIGLHRTLKKEKRQHPVTKPCWRSCTIPIF